MVVCVLIGKPIVYIPTLYIYIYIYIPIVCVLSFACLFFSKSLKY